MTGQGMAADLLDFKAAQEIDGVSFMSPKPVPRAVCCRPDCRQVTLDIIFSFDE
jgi:hypothetical protein